MPWVEDMGLFVCGNAKAGAASRAYTGLVS